jgi:hypothetical protein
LSVIQIVILKAQRCFAFVDFRYESTTDLIASPNLPLDSDINPRSRHSQTGKTMSPPRAPHRPSSVRLAKSVT